MDGGGQRIIVGWGQDLGVTVKTDSKPSDGQSHCRHKRGGLPSSICMAPFLPIVLRTSKKDLLEGKASRL